MTNQGPESGDLREDYERNNDRIAQLRAALEQAGDHMSALGAQLRKDPSQVQVDGGEFFITDEFYVSSMGRSAAIQYRTISAEAIERNLAELASRMERKQELEGRLREAGAERRIRP